MGAARTDAKQPAKPLPASTPKVIHHRATVPKAPAARPQLADVRIEAQRNGSWLEVRRGSSSGTVLYSGVLVPGTQLHFRAPRVWARLGAAGNLSIVANGRPVSLQGTYDKVFLPASKKVRGTCPGRQAALLARAQIPRLTLTKLARGRLPTPAR